MRTGKNRKLRIFSRGKCNEHLPPAPPQQIPMEVFIMAKNIPNSSLKKSNQPPIPKLSEEQKAAILNDFIKTYQCEFDKLQTRCDMYQDYCENSQNRETKYLEELKCRLQKVKKIERWYQSISHHIPKPYRLKIGWAFLDCYFPTCVSKPCEECPYEKLGKIQPAKNKKMNVLNFADFKK